MYSSCDTVNTMPCSMRHCQQCEFRYHAQWMLMTDLFPRVENSLMSVLKFGNVTTQAQRDNVMMSRTTRVSTHLASSVVPSILMRTTCMQVPNSSRGVDRVRKVASFASGGEREKSTGWGLRVNGQNAYSLRPSEHQTCHVPSHQK